MADQLELTVTDDDAEEQPDNVVLTINGTPVASTLDENDDTVEVSPEMRMGIGPAQLEADDFAQAWVRVEEDETFELMGWGLIDSDEESPDDFELAVQDSDDEVYANNGMAWETDEDGDPLATVDGPANVFVQLRNNSGDDITADSEAQDWLAANFGYEVA